MSDFEADVLEIRATLVALRETLDRMIDWSREAQDEIARVRSQTHAQQSAIEALTSDGSEAER